MAKTGQDWQDWTIKTIFHFTKSFFDKKQSKSPQANICGKDLLRPLRHSFFFFWSPPSQNLELKVVPSAEKGGGGTDTVVDKKLWTNRSMLFWAWFFFYLLLISLIANFEPLLYFFTFLFHPWISLDSNCSMFQSTLDGYKLLLSFYWNLVVLKLGPTDTLQSRFYK